MFQLLEKKTMTLKMTDPVHIVDNQWYQSLAQRCKPKYQKNSLDPMLYPCLHASGTRPLIDPLISCECRTVSQS
jgi:hypothetical protein